MEKKIYNSPQTEEFTVQMEMNCMSPAFAKEILILDGGSEEYDNWD